MPRPNTARAPTEFDDEAPVTIRYRSGGEQRFFQLSAEQLKTVHKHAPNAHAELVREHTGDNRTAWGAIAEAARSDLFNLQHFQQKANETGQTFSDSGQACIHMLADLQSACVRAIEDEKELDGLAREHVAATTGVGRSGWRDANGKPVVVLSPKDAFPRGGERSDVRVGELMRAMLVPTKDERIRNSLGEGADATGGVTVPQIVLPQWIDKLRAATVVIQAGARTVRLDTQVTSMARLATDPVAAWRNENQALTDADPTFEKVTFTARSIYALVKVSLELLQDSVNITEILETALTRALALEMDRVALFGTGTPPEPRGVFNTSGIQSVSMGVNGATPTNFDNIVDLLVALANANAPKPTAMIAAPRTTYGYAKLKDTTSQPLVPPKVVSDVPMLETTTVPVNQTQGTSTDASSIIAGNFAELMIGLRQELRLQVLREVYMGNMQVGFLAHMRGDVQVEHPAVFGKLIGIRP